MNKNKIIIGTAQSDPNYGINKSKNFLKLSKVIRNNNFMIDTAITYKNSNMLIKKIGKNYENIINKIPFIKKTKIFK